MYQTPTQTSTEFHSFLHKPHHNNSSKTPILSHKNLMLFLFLQPKMTNRVSADLFSDNDDSSTPQPSPIDFTNLPTSYPQVSILTNQVIQKVPISSFVWLEKTDGTRTILLIERNQVFDITRSPTLLFKISGPQFSGRTILDTEFYNNFYHTFDIIFCNNTDVSNLHFLERMKHASTLFSNTTGSKIIIKTFNPVTSWSELISFTNQRISPNTGNTIDGVICQRTDRTYFTTMADPGCFKLKKTVLNTIDFQLKHHTNKNVFWLYLSGRYYNFKYNLRYLPRRNPCLQIDTGFSESNVPKGTIPVLFSSPYQNGLHLFNPSTEWDSSDYFPEDVTTIKRLIRDMKRNPQSFHNAIVEMSLANNTWVPMRIREDKKHPNNYEVGITNCGVMFSPLNPEDSYFTQTTSGHISTDIIDAYHNTNRVMRRFILENALNSSRKISVLDLAGGRGADELELFHCGAYNIIAVDADREALTQYVNRSNERVFKKSWEPLIPGFRDNKPHNGLMLNVICDILGPDNDNLVNLIQQRGEYKHGFDVVLMNYAIHYLCYDHECLVALSSLINKVLKDDGIFIFTSFDGDRIRKDAKNKILKLGGVFEIKLIDPPDNEGIEISPDSQWARMPLPTIDKTGYRDEPLVFKSWIKNDLDLEIVNHYYLVDECAEYIKNIKNVDLVVDYLKYIQVYIMKKK